MNTRGETTCFYVNQSGIIKLSFMRKVDYPVRVGAIMINTVKCLYMTMGIDQSIIKATIPMQLLLQSLIYRAWNPPQPPNLFNYSTLFYKPLKKKHPMTFWYTVACFRGWVDWPKISMKLQKSWSCGREFKVDLKELDTNSICNSCIMRWSRSTIAFFKLKITNADNPATRRLASLFPLRVLWVRSIVE